MTNTTGTLQNEWLNLLTDGPSSLAAFYATQTNVFAYTGEVAPLMHALLELQNEGWVELGKMAPDGPIHPATPAECQATLAQYEAWLPGVTIEDAAWDKIGVWAEVTEQGYAHWREHLSEVDRRSAPMTKPERFPLF